MTNVDLLSDTIYRDHACTALDHLLRGHRKFPVTKSQLYGLRQIARQQPTSVKEFAEHQRQRVERRLQGPGHSPNPVNPEVCFWRLVHDLFDSTSRWSVRKEALAHAPKELREENIPARHSGMTNEDRRHRNLLKAEQRKWLGRWTTKHVPLFFDRFCTHALYRLRKMETAAHRGPRHDDA